MNSRFVGGNDLQISWARFQKRLPPHGKRKTFVLDVLASSQIQLIMF